MTNNRLNNIFRDKKDILSIFFTAGFPNLNNTAEIMLGLQEYGADIIEIGIPYSDPLADGPLIQRTSMVALENGMNTNFLFQQLEKVKEKMNLPLVLMGNINPVMRYGVDKFCDKAGSLGIDGVILPDLPIDEYENSFKIHFERNNLHNIFLITPQTSEERIRKIDELSTAFIYMVSSHSTTGAKEGFHEDNIDYFKRIKAMSLKSPTLIGFGISNHATYQKVCEYSNGAIIGSAFLKALNTNNLNSSIKHFMDSIKNKKDQR